MPLPNGAAIKAIRQARGFTGADLGRAAGVSHGHIFNMENPERRKHASDQVLSAIADVLDVPICAIVVPTPVVQKTRRPSLQRAA